MLVLTRRPTESLIITTGNETIVVHIADVQGRQVRVGIEAPKHVKIMRDELLENRGNR